MGQMVNDDTENDRLKFKNDYSSTQVDTFESVEEASRFGDSCGGSEGLGTKTQAGWRIYNLLSICTCHHLKRKAGLFEHRKHLRSCQRRED